MKESRLKKLNKLILVLHIVFPLWFYMSVYTIGISFYSLLGSIVCMIVTKIVYQKARYINNGTKIINALRAGLLLCLAGIYLPSLVLLNFKNTKSMYSIKRLDYAHGVYGKNAEYYKNLLPERLPDECEDYSFITRGCMIAQDYHASSCLSFRTDERTIDSYAKYYGGICDERRVKDESENEIKGIDWFCDNARIDESKRDEFENAELYWINGNFPNGALLDKDSGYVVILT